MPDRYVRMKSDSDETVICEAGLVIRYVDAWLGPVVYVGWSTRPRISWAGGAMSRRQRRTDRLFHRIRLGTGVKRVPQEHGRRRNGADRIGDVLPGNGRGRAVDRLEQTGAPADARRGQQAERADHRTRFVRKDIAEQVAR